MWIPSTWFTVILPVVVFGGSALLWGMFHPRSRIMGPLWFRGGPAEPGQKPRVALTFDDGPTPDATPAVLDALAAVDAPAAFFVIGQNVHRHPRLLRRIHDEGHLVGNHSYHHDRQGLWGLNAFWRRQLDETDDAVAELIGVRPLLFRPPMGLKHWHMLTEVTYGGHRTVTWSRKARDGGKRPRQRNIVRRLTRARDGDILLLHDGQEPDHPRSRRATADAVIPLVNQLRDRGFDIVRLDELLDLPAYRPVDDADV
jgi:peptidoglycan/xylan/chitin deacetylase (PgdA/CDA1 family)